VLVDQIVSPTPGLISQMTGFLMKKRYKYSTVLFDQFYRLGCVYLQNTAMAEETVKGKNSFEELALSHGIRVERYHVDNGIFKARQWVENKKEAGQGLIFAGVGAHHQKGITEKRIGGLQDLARTMMIHAHRRWPRCITAHIWSYAVINANNVLNEAPILQDKQMRIASVLRHQSGNKYQTLYTVWMSGICSGCKSPEWFTSPQMENGREWKSTSAVPLTIVEMWH
jgi:hypothetical protein